jgi:hypothetical protein
LNSNTLNEIQIPLKIDGMQIGVKDIDYDVGKKSRERHKSKKTLFHSSLFGNWLNIF